jgi:hypothetical protein
MLLLGLLLLFVSGGGVGAATVTLEQDHAASPRDDGRVCPNCRLVFVRGWRRCPYDGAALMAPAVDSENGFSW